MTKRYYNIEFSNKKRKDRSDKLYLQKGFHVGNADLEYMIPKHRILTKEEEIVLGNKALAGDKQAQDELVSCNYKLVVSIAKKYASSLLPLDDCISIGSIGLIEATKRFDPKRKVRFCTYATYWIRMHLQKAVCNLSPNCIHVPRYHSNIGKDIRIGKEVSDSQQDIFKLGEMARAPSKSIYVLEELDDPSAAVIPIEEKPRFSDADYLLLNQALDSLEERDRIVITACFGLGEFDRSHTLDEVGKLLTHKVGRERVRQLRDRAMERLIDILIPLRVKSHEEVA